VTAVLVVVDDTEFGSWSSGSNNADDDGDGSGCDFCGESSKTIFRFFLVDCAAATAGWGSTNAAAGFAFAAATANAVAVAGWRWSSTNCGCG